MKKLRFFKLPKSYALRGIRQRLYRFPFGIPFQKTTHFTGELSEFTCKGEASLLIVVRGSYRKDVMYLKRRAELEERFQDLTAWLRHYHWREGYSLRELGYILGMSHQAVADVIRERGMKVRDRYTAQRQARVVKRPSKNKLFKMYITDEISSVKIGETYGVDSATVLKWLRHDGTCVRTHHEWSAILYRDKRPSKEDLMALYSDYNLSGTVIASCLDALPANIYNNLHRYGIHVRSRGRQKHCG